MLTFLFPMATTLWRVFCTDVERSSVLVDAPYKSGPSKAWLKIKNPKAPAATRAAMDFLDRERNLSPELDGLRPSVPISPKLAALY
jgi:hypothetical protein